MDRAFKWNQRSHPPSDGILSEKSTPAWPRVAKRSRSRWWATAGCTIVLLLVCRYWIFAGERVPQGLSALGVFNRTLGFQQIFVISSPQRSDRHDRFALAAAYTDFTFEFSDAVDESGMLAKAVPETWNSTDHAEGELGKWRAHMNVLQKIIQHGVQSALIFEDDADFDVTFKHQLAFFAEGIRTLTGENNVASSAAPYGTSWDMLRVGSCSIGTSDSATQIYVAEYDSTVPPLQRRHGLFMDSKLPPEALANDTRLVFKTTNSGNCLMAYAVTYTAAQKILAVLSMRPHSHDVGAAYGKLCAGELHMPVVCYGVYPTLVGVHQSSRPGANETTTDIVYSMKQNLPQLAVGNTTILSQWSNDVVRPFRRLEEPLVTGRQYLKIIDRSTLLEKRAPGINVPWE